ncbi:GapS1 family protein [Pleionea sediminis]|uniref:GapS1 family protein n=1 Tax=Pleionea sediminis TaxID=2569479 RepID=UPI001186D1FB|nr:hypothetical protein [Pleionea sediminis]
MEVYQEMSFSDKEFKLSVNKVKRRLRAFGHEDFLINTINYLNYPSDRKYGFVERQPWLLMLLLKWKFKLESGKKKLTYEKFYKLINFAHKNLSNKIKMPTEYTHYNLFFRNVAYQQFYYQDDFSLPRLIRQYIFFCDKPKNHSINCMFEGEYKIGVKEFTMLSLYLMTLINDSKSIEISRAQFKEFDRNFGGEKVDMFLDAISVRIEDVKRNILKYENTTSNKFYSEYYEESPFHYFPLIKISSYYYCIHKSILGKLLENFVYDSLTKISREEFNRHFTKIFEKYVEDIFVDNFPSAWTERKLKTVVNNDSKVVDLLYSNKDVNIFIDAKAVEMPHRGKVSDSSNIVLGRVKSSALKAIKQACELNSFLNYNSDSQLPKYKRESYLLVITMKDLFLGNGVSFFESVAVGKYEELHEEFGESNCIKPSNIYFITIDDFDFLMQLKKEESLDLIDIIRDATVRDSRSQTRMFHFTQHLHKLNLNSGLPLHLDKHFERLVREYSSTLLGK